jgi:hypothetical protein
MFGSLIGSACCGRPSAVDDLADEGGELRDHRVAAGSVKVRRRGTGGASVRAR